MERKCAVTRPTNTTGPKARMTSSSETKKNHKTKTKQKKTLQKLRPTKTHSQADKGRMKNSLGFLALTMKIKTDKNKNKS